MVSHLEVFQCETTSRENEYSKAKGWIDFFSYSMLSVL